MRLMIYILFIFLLESCFVKKDIPKEFIVEKPESIVDTIIYSQERLLLKSRVEEERLSSPLPIKDKSNSKSSRNLNKYNIKNYIDTTTVVNYDMGIIGYNIPSNFKVNEWSTIKLRISRKNKIESIVLGKGSRPIPLTDINSKDEIIIDKIKVDNLMTAKLYSDDNVELKMVTNGDQRISDDGYTEWVWRIKPKTTEHCYIKMVITMSDVDYVVYEEEILVEPNWTWSFSNWFSKWWQAITATIITPILIPLIIWFRSRRKSSKESD
jgi:hypothetical protein